MNRTVILLVAALTVLAGGGFLLTEIVQAQGTPIGPGPCPPNWTCDCNTTVLEDYHCPLGNGTQGSVVVTICQECPPPDCSSPTGACRIFPCEYSVSASCQ